MTRSILNLVIIPITLSLVTGCEGRDAKQSNSAGETGGETGDGDGDGDGDGETGDGDGIEGPFVYSEFDPEGVLMIDALFVLTEQAVQQIVSRGQTPREFLDWRIDDLNSALDRSLLDTSRVRTLGYHVLTEQDYARVGAWPADTLDNINYALGWLSSYRSTYGGDKILMIASTAESQSGAAWGGGDVSSYWVDFLPINHEFGHCMGGGHCNDGNPDNYNFGFPLRGYDDAGVPNASGLSGGTMMCGNSVNFFSNPEVALTLADITEYVAQGIMPAQDYEAVLGPDGILTLGDDQYANMVQTWRDNEDAAATATFTSKYPGYEDTFYEKDDCAAFYSKEGYGGLLKEFCVNDTAESLEADGVASVMLGRNVHVNLYTDAEYGAGSTCGGILQRLAFSSPSLEALADHRGMESIAGQVKTALIYPPIDRDSHAFFNGGFDFYSSGDLPFCSSIDGQNLTLMRDSSYWSGAAAFRKVAVDPPYTISFEYFSKHYVEEPHGDGIVVFFAKDKNAYDGASPPNGNLGFIPDGTGYGVEFNSWTNSVALRDGDYNVIGAAVGADTYTNGAWIPIEVTVQTDSVTAAYNGVELLTEVVTLDTSYDGIGVSAGNGFYTSEATIRDFAITPL